MDRIGTAHTEEYFIVVSILKNKFRMKVCVPQKFEKCFGLNKVTVECWAQPVLRRKR